MIYIVCGVSGTGKTTIGKSLSEHLQIPFYDGDDFHPKENVKKMASGRPLTDEDRSGWLKTLANNIRVWQKEGGAVLACSALKETYRELLGGDIPEIQWVVLEGDRQLILDRMNQRKGHFFSADMLDSQIEIYSCPSYGWILNVESTPDKIMKDLILKLKKL
ncbi:MAG: gluconokinase [Bacteroidota bacterium]